MSIRIFLRRLCRRSSSVLRGDGRPSREAGPAGFRRPCGRLWPAADQQAVPLGACPVGAPMDGGGGMHGNHGSRSRERSQQAHASRPPAGGDGRRGRAEGAAAGCRAGWAGGRDRAGQRYPGAWPQPAPCGCGRREPGQPAAAGRRSPPRDAEAGFHWRGGTVDCTDLGYPMSRPRCYWIGTSLQQRGRWSCG